MSENPDIRKQEQAEAFRGEEWLEVEDVKRWFKDKASVAPTHIFYPLTKRMHPIDHPDPWRGLIRKTARTASKPTRTRGPTRRQTEHRKRSHEHQRRSAMKTL